MPPKDLSTHTADPVVDRSDLTRLFAAMMQHFGCDPTAVTKSDHVTDIMTRHPSCEVMLARRGGKAVGFASFSVIFPDGELNPILYMRVIFVLAEARSQGVGTEMVRALARLALRRGCARIDWATEISNTAAHALYDRIGATRLAHVVNYKLAGDTLKALAGQ
jgi:RimJ/RimL family protein N-acetyltransferase